MEKSKVYHILSSLNEIKWKITLKGIFVGFISGLIVVLYRMGIEFGTEKAVLCYKVINTHPLLILPWIGLMGIIGLVIYLLVKFEPMASGSGIPQVEGILIYGLKIKWYTVLMVRFIAGILASFMGVSLGREGPSIQIGAAASQGLAKKICKSKLEENYLITSGAAAGLSAAFNAPLSGILFTLEEVHRSFSPQILIASTSAALTADVVSKYFFGLKPVLSFVEVPQIPEYLYPVLILLGILAGLLGSLINKALLLFQTLYSKFPAILRPIIALFIALPCGLFLPQVLGGGQNLIKLSEHAQQGIVFIIILLLVKFIFTCTSFGSGIPGGIFMPILSLGALTGSAFGLWIHSFGISLEFVPVFCVCAMAAALSASIKAPITSILLMVEMSGSLIHLFPVAVCSFIALLVSDLVRNNPIYEALLERIMNKNIESIQSNNRGALVEVPVEMGSEISGKKVREIEWPINTLLISIHRGEKEIIPNGNTKILQGDYLVVLSSEGRYEEIHRQMKQLCQI